MSTPTNAELQDQVTRLQAQIETLGLQPRERTRRRGVRMVLGVVTIAALLAVPIGVFASHSFTDVPDTNTFHTQIARVKGAGITSGCTPTKYCPDDAVTRGQMAAFLARTGGRNDTDAAPNSGGVTVGDAEVSLVTVTVKAGDVTGGYAIVQFTGSINAITSSATGLPSYLIGYVREVGTTAHLSNYAFAQVDVLAGGSFGVATAPLVGSVVVPTGVTKSFEVIGYRGYGTGSFAGSAALSATYVPFAGTGANALPIADSKPVAGSKHDAAHP